MQPSGDRGTSLFPFFSLGRTHVFGGRYQCTQLYTQINVDLLGDLAREEAIIFFRLSIKEP